MTQPRSKPTEILPGLNNTGSTIAAYRVVVRDATGVDEIALPGAVTDDVYGVTMAAILDDKYGDIQTRGVAICTAAAAITQGARLMMDTAGKVLTWTAAGGANAAVVGIADIAAGAFGDLLEVTLAGPATSRQG